MNATGFDGLVPDATVDIRERQGLIDGLRLTGAKLAAISGALLITTIGATILGRRY